MRTKLFMHIADILVKGKAVDILVALTGLSYQKQTFS